MYIKLFKVGGRGGFSLRQSSHIECNELCNKESTLTIIIMVVDNCTDKLIMTLAFTEAYFLMLSGPSLNIHK